MIMFLSDGKEVKGTDWIENHYDYVSDLTDAKVIELDCGHSVHNFKQDQIAEEIREFLGEELRCGSLAEHAVDVHFPPGFDIRISGFTVIDQLIALHDRNCAAGVCPLFHETLQQIVKF